MIIAEITAYNFHSVTPRRRLDIFFSLGSCSRVYLNGAPVETEFRSEGLLFVRELKPKVGDEIFVAQISISDETQILSQTKTFVWTQ